MAEEPVTKKQKTEGYVLYYWPGLPGRGEYVRLALEYLGLPYTERTSANTLLSTITNPAKSSHPPAFAPPALQLPSGRFVSQTPAILNYLSGKFELAGQDDDEKEETRAVVNALVLTALDLCNESHDTHHPLDVTKYYAEQKEAAIERAAAHRAHRIPKFLSYFQKVLNTNPETTEEGDGKTYLVGTKTTTADLVLFHLLCGLEYAFPKRLAALKATGEYDYVWKLKARVENEKGVKEYLASGRRQKFNENGVFRYYPELDGEE